MKKRTISFYIIFGIIAIIVAILLSILFANVLYLVYSPNPQEIIKLTPKLCFERFLTVKPINNMFWIILLVFGILALFTKFTRIFGLKDYKSKVYKVTDDIEIPIPVGEKQTQQGSSWWLSSKQYPKVFDVNTLDPENPTISKILHNANEETKAIKRINVKQDEEGKVDEDNLLSEIDDKYSKMNLINIDNQDSKPFKKGGIVLGRKERRVFKKTNKFPFFKARTVEDIYFVGDNVHTLTVGATRSGKTRCLVIESIYNCGLAGESMVISDPKGELFEYTSGALKQLGYNVVTLDFKNPTKSSCYNFLQPVINEIEKGNYAQAQNKASDIVESLVGEAKGEKIWNDGEKSTIKTGIMSICMEAPKEYQNIANVYYFLANMCKEQDDKSMLMDEFLEQIREGTGFFEFKPKKDENGNILKEPILDENGDEVLDEDGNVKLRDVLEEREGDQNHPAIASFAPASIAPSKTRSSFFTSALNTLVLFADEYIASMTSKTEIRAEDLANKKTVLYMILPDEKLTFYSLCSLFVNQIYQQLVNIADNRGGELKNRVNFILDEFGNFSAIPNFGGFLTVGGGRKIRFNLFLQSFSQLNSKYDENTAQNILDNCHIWTYLKTSNDTTAEKISKKLGTYTCTSYSESNSGNIGGASVNRSKSMQLTQRALLTPAEVLRINRPYLLVMYAGQNPAMTKAPDLSKWRFNEMLSLGDQPFCTKVRTIRETARKEREDQKLKIWDIDTKMKEYKEQQKALEEANKSERLNRKRTSIF